jgi:general secretion pathway protein F
MPAFRYKALNPSGAIDAGSCDADSEEAAQQVLKQRGLMVLELRPALSESQGSNWRSNWTFGRVPPRRVTQLLNDLAVLTRSNILIDEALGLLEREAADAALRPVLLQVRTDLASGRSLSDALDRYPHMFPPFQTAMVRIAETSGSLPTVLARIAEERARFEALRARVFEALRYPFFLLLGTIGVLIFFLTSVVPEFEPILAQTDQVDTIIATALGVSQFLRTNWSILLGGICILVIGVVMAMQVERTRAAMGRALLLIPGVAGLTASYRAARFTRLLAMMTESGVNAQTALRLSGHVIQPSFAPDWAGQAADDLRRGRRISDAIARLALPELAVRMVRLGEETGNLAALSHQAAAFYEARLDRSLGQLVAVAGPAAVMLISLVIGGTVISIVSALMSINNMVR